MDLLKKCGDFTEAREAMAAGIYPYFHALESGQDTEVIMDGKRVIMIGSNNYMGLTSDSRTIQAAKDALDKYGTGCSGSRFLNGTLVLHEQLEDELADFFNKEAALTIFNRIPDKSRDHLLYSRLSRLYNKRLGKTTPAYATRAA